jgi:deoxycytidylate deaminase
LQINYNKGEFCRQLKKEDILTHIKKRFTNSGTKDEFNEELNQFNFKDQELVRPGWDTYFMRMAELAA